MRVVKTATFALAAAGLALGGVANAKETTSVNMLPQATSADDAAAPAEKKKKRRGAGYLLGIAGLAVLIGGVAMIGDSGSDTPG
ncbi:hypothetical protein [Croceicoccus gelatinilyticus]|uniref:hypothetical protein n=1 Tax=Croceicoccus gelatinilyticus TaxID=2835536 RepID=UPI001BCEF5B7|nr:hypothetical protein [Croceicoccus gelatinilyticus]MBS7669680.1 hypothetical protein [Croceicoccus gelatinilyticus]